MNLYEIRFQKMFPFLKPDFIQVHVVLSMFDVFLFPQIFFSLLF